MVKLSLYKASNAPIILIVRIVKNKLCLFIKWNMIYNTFEEGQFLKNKQLFDCAISSDGTLVYYMYNEYGINNNTHTILSKVPNATAIYYGSENVGRWGTTQFNISNGNIPIDNGANLKITSYGIQHEYQNQILIDNDTQINKTVSNSGKISSDTFQNQDKTHTYQVDKCRILMDGHIIYDCTHREFVSRVADESITLANEASA